MNVNQIIELVEQKTGKSERTIREVINKRFKFLPGIKTKKTAALLVARMFGVNIEFSEEYLDIDLVFKRFRIYRLFNMFEEHEIKIKSKDGITVLYGINGIGKSTLLQLISSFQKKDYNTIDRKSVV